MTRQLLRAGLARYRAALRDDHSAAIPQDLSVVLAGHLIRLLIGLASSVLLARSLGPQGLSTFAVLGAAIALGITIADAGLSTSALRLIPADLGDEPERALRTAASYARLRLLGALLVAVLALALAEPIAAILRLPAPTERALIAAACLGLVATSLSGIVATLLQALSRFRALVAGQTLNIALTLLLVAGLYLIGKLAVLWALLIGAVTAIAAACLGLFLLPREWRRALWSRGAARGAESGRLLRFGRWLWLAAILSMLSAQLDLLLLNRWTEPYQVGLYALALNLALKVDLINQTLHTVLLPRVAALASRGAYARYIRSSLTRSLTLALGLALLLPLAAPAIIALYGADYAPSIDIFYLLVGVIIFDLFSGPLLLLAFPLNMPRQIAIADAARVAGLSLAAVLLIPLWGVHGAALAKLAGKVAGALVLGIPIAAELRKPKQAATNSDPAPDSSSPPDPLPPDSR